MALAAGLVMALAVVAYVRLSAHRSAEPHRGVAAGEGVRAESRAEGLATSADARGFLYGRVTTVDGATYEGRLRFDGLEEAFWSDLFNGRKTENLWAALVPAGELPTESHPVRVFGLEFSRGEGPIDLERPFAARFGDLVRLDASSARVRATLKSGTVVELDRFEAGDFDDGVRVWDARGVVDLDTLQIASIEFAPTPALAELPRRLHGRVQSRQGVFTGFVAWSGRGALATDSLLLEGRPMRGRGFRPPMGEIRSLERAEGGGLRVTTIGGEVETISGASVVLVEDRRFGRVQVGWADFERVDFDDATDAGSGPAYDAFAPGAPLSGRVTLTDGRELAGRLVFDLDENETTDLLDAPRGHVNFSIPFDRIASLVLPDPKRGTDPLALLSTRCGDALQLDFRGDLAATNGGLLIFATEGSPPEYVPWPTVRRLDLDGPPPGDCPPADN